MTSLLCAQQLSKTVVSVAVHWCLLDQSLPKATLSSPSM